uniref:CCHC-type domain-containing protein n=1 Tax=Strigamia maritima TaxID=126957 RepID=T1IKN8_STRMM
MTCTLPSQYHNVVSIMHRWDDAQFTAANVEKTLIEEFESLKSRELLGVNPNNSSDNSALSTNQKNPKRKQNKEIICFNCGIKGHYSSDCRKKPKKEIKCSNCGIQGHYGASCRKGKSKGSNANESVSFSHFSDSLIIDGLNVSITDNEWIWDTGSGAHLCHDRNLFTELTIGKPYKMNAYAGTFDVEGIGTVCFNHIIGNEVHRITLNKVGYAPSGKRNLISGSRAMQAGCTWSGKSNEILVRNKQNRD